MHYKVIVLSANTESQTNKCVMSRFVKSPGQHLSPLAMSFTHTDRHTLAEPGDLFTNGPTTVLRTPVVGYDIDTTPFAIHEKWRIYEWRKYEYERWCATAAESTTTTNIEDRNVDDRSPRDARPVADGGTVPCPQSSEIFF